MVFQCVVRVISVIQGRNKESGGGGGGGVSRADICLECERRFAK